MMLLLDLLEVAVAGIELLEVAVRTAGRAVSSVADFGRRILGRDFPEQDDQEPAAGSADGSPIEREREH